MKQITKRMITALLVLATVLAWVPSGVLADNEVTEAEASIVCVNPVYADVLTEGDLLDAEDVEDEATLCDDIQYTNVAAAAAELGEEMKERQTSIQIHLTSTDSDYTTLISRLVAKALEHNGDPAEGDYLKWCYGGYRCSISYGLSDGTYRYTFRFTMSYYTTAAQEAEMDTAVEAVLNTLDVYNATDYQKVRAVYDYIVSNVTYDDTSTCRLRYTAYAALVNGTSVCQGYATLMYRLLLELGVDCRVIVGDAGGSHAWNIVALGGRYYNADSTWDATAYPVLNEYYFFLKGSNTYFTRGGSYAGGYADAHEADEDYTTAAFTAAYPISADDYRGPSAVYSTGWNKIDGSWYYVNADLSFATGWGKIDGAWYYFNDSGVMQTGWQKVDGKWYYLNNSMQTGWQKIDGKWYYLNTEMKTGWQKIDGKWYYLNTEMKTGWQKINGSWYYLNNAMVTGWQKINNNWYYFGTNGVMVSNCTMTINGTSYTFNASGVWVS